jgi:seryl-tRNA synthetase
MISIELIRENPEIVRNGMKKRGQDPAPVDAVFELDIKRRELIQEVETLKAERNVASKEIGQTKDKDERQEKIEAMREVGDRIKSLEDELSEVDAEYLANISIIPNVPMDVVPEGFTDDDNIVEREEGPIPQFDFEPKPHWDLGPELGIIDFERGVKLSGTRFYVLSGAAARLQRALISFFLDIHTSKQGYVEKYMPFMVKEEILYGAGQLPKFRNNLYKDHEEDFYLVPTSEVPLTGLHMGEIIEEKDLPLKYTAYSPCFRREKMSAGRDVRGIKRGHQFDKVEMYKYCLPENSMDEFYKMLADAEEVCKALGLRYRVILKCAGDTSESAMISYDLDVWAAGCNEWLEISSISNVGDFQARRGQIRYRPENGGKPEYVHTLNGSGLALPRVMIAVMENNQQEDGSILIPEVLRPFMGGFEVIK